MSQARVFPRHLQAALRTHLAIGQAGSLHRGVELPLPMVSGHVGPVYLWARNQTCMERLCRAVTPARSAPLQAGRAVRCGTGTGQVSAWPWRQPPKRRGAETLAQKGPTWACGSALIGSQTEEMLNATVFRSSEAFFLFNYCFSCLLIRNGFPYC